MHIRLALLFALAAVWPAAPAAGQSTAGGVAPLEPVAGEEALALSAAPPDVARGAAVWVLGARGYERVREGTNGWSCLVERDHPESLAPICYDPAGAASVMPAVLELARLRQEGRSYAEAKAAVLARVRSGELPTPERPVLSLMLSPGQRLYTAPDGDPVGAWLPHVMIHFPGLTNAGMGLESTGGLASVQDEGLPTSYLIIPVARWSDGRSASGG